MDSVTRPAGTLVPPQPLAGSESLPVGSVVLDLYEVKGVHEGGAMGLVYRVRHREWDIDLAMKSPRPDLVRDPRQRASFVREAETWARLDSHPHVCTCHYVRAIDGTPHIFSEYVEGGSLREWIDDRRVYDGGPDAALARILDVAIQLAWGLDHAHREGLVHQDVKPANALLDQLGTLKVADFGLARARFGPAAGLTPAYASPEQLAGEQIGRTSDVWSYGLTLVDLLSGGAGWQSGPDAAAALDALLLNRVGEAAAVRVPAGLVDLLRRCLRREPGERPDGMAELAGELREIHARELGDPHPRGVPRLAELRADALNNRALSLLDLGRDPEECWRQALDADPQHLLVTFNRGLIRWRTGQETDQALVGRLEPAVAEQWEAAHLLAQVHLERGDAAAAAALLDGLPARTERVPAVSRTRRIAEGRAGIRRGRVFGGELAAGRTAALSGDGRLLLAAGATGRSPVLWDLESGSCLRTFDGHEHWVTSVSLSPDGRLGLSGSHDRTVRLWDVERGSCLQAFAGHEHWVTAVSLGAGGRLALSGSQDRTVRLWDADTGSCLRTLEGHTDSITAVVLSADGKLALSGSRDRTLRLWDLATGRCIRTFAGHSDAVTALSLGTDDLAVSGSRDRTILVWSLASAHPLRALRGHEDAVTGICLVPQLGLALSASEDATLRVWELESGRCLRTIDDHTDSVTAVCTSADGRVALSAGDDGAARTWELAPAANVCLLQVARPRAHASLLATEARAAALIGRAEEAERRQDPAAALALLREARDLTGHERSAPILAAWRRLAGECRRVGIRGAWSAHVFHDRSGIGCVATAGRRALSAGDDGTIALRDLDSRSCVGHLVGHTGPVAAVSSDAAALRAVSASHDRTVRVWDLERGSCLRTLEGHRDVVAAVDVTADGRFAVSGSHDRAVRLWDLDGGRCVRTLVGHGDVVTSVRVTPDGGHALSAGGDRTLRLWDLVRGRCVRVFSGHRSRVACVDLSGDCRTIASAGADGTVHVWELETAAVLATFDHSGAVASVRLTPDGRYVVSAAADGIVRLWEVATGRCLRTLAGHAGAVRALCVSTDGHGLLSGGVDGTLRAWELDWELEPADLVEVAAASRPFLDRFLACHTPYRHDLPDGAEPLEEETRAALTRSGPPSWGPVDLEALQVQLAAAGLSRGLDVTRTELARLARHRG